MRVGFREGGTFDEIWVEVGGVLDEPGLALLEIGAELAVLGGQTAHRTVKYANRLGFFRHGRIKMKKTKN